MRRKKPTCFVVMPFGRKTILGERQGKPVATEIDFNQVYESYIRKAVEAAGHRAERSDSIGGGASIVGSLIDAIYKADMVLADASYHNPNVFYELGLRHGLRRNGTVVIRRTGGDFAVTQPRWGRNGFAPPPVPFDIRDVQIHDFSLSADTLEKEIGALKRRIEDAANAEGPQSPVFHHMPALRVVRAPQPVPGRRDRTYEIVGAPGKMVGYRSGDIANLKGPLAVDYWVNSENTAMQMARMFERSISSTVRNLGARDADPASPGFEDTIALELKRALGNAPAAKPGDILVTTSGRLAETHGVKAILHAATVTCIERKGWRPIPDEVLVETVGRLIQKADEMSRSNAASDRGTSMMMPLFGTGQAQRDPATIASQLVEAAIEALAALPAYPGADGLKTVLFSAYSTDDVDIVRRIFETHVRTGSLKPVASTTA